MAKPEWGTKRVCQGCSGVYYDFKKVPPLCPTCGTKFDPEALLRSRRGRTLPDDGAGKPEIEAVEAKDDELAVLEDDALVDEVEDDEEEDALIEDASELGEDDDDVGVPVVGTGDDH